MSGSDPRQPRVGGLGRANGHRDPWTIADAAPALLRHAARTCYLIGAAAIASRRARRLRLHRDTYGPYNSLCPDEPFWQQPVAIERSAGGPGDFGYTGYLISPDTVLTCWHGWEYFSSRAQVAVLGYAVQPADGDPTELPSAQVLPVAAYPAAMSVSGEVQGSGRGDWVLLQLEHPVTHLGSLPAPLIGSPRAGCTVYTLGHPCGLPLKLADSATVLNLQDGVFRTDLDTFAGNSGSPVFDAENHALIGMVIQGQAGKGDFVPAPDRSCYIVNHIQRGGAGQLSVTADSFGTAVTRRTQYGSR